MGRTTILKGMSEDTFSVPQNHGKIKGISQEGETRMSLRRNKRTKLTLRRPSPYPLPLSLLIGFWGE